MDTGFEKRKKDFEGHFQEYKFKCFEKFIGVPENEFRDLYRQYKYFVQDYFNNFVPSGKTLYPLVAEICSYVELDFYTTLEDDHCRVHYPAVSILDGEYYATPDRKKVIFLSCDEVMKRLMWLYWVNRAFFDEGKATAESYATEYQESPECEYSVDGLDEFPF